MIDTEMIEKKYDKTHYTNCKTNCLEILYKTTNCRFINDRFLEHFKVCRVF